MSLTEQPYEICDQETGSELEELILQIRHHNHSTTTFLLTVPAAHLHVPALHMRRSFQQLQRSGQNLKTHYGWTLASDGEQTARVEKMLHHQSGCEKEDCLRRGRGSQKMKEIFAEFERLNSELEQACIRFEEDVRLGRYRNV